MVLFTKIKLGVVTVVSVILAWLVYRVDSLKKAKVKADSKAAQLTAELYLRREVKKSLTNTKREVRELKDEGTQKVSDAKPNTAVDWLRQHANRNKDSD